MNDAAQLVTLLTERGLTLGVAESLTGGAVAAEIVSVPGASAALRGAVVAYDTAIKHTLLGVDAELLAEHGPVHPEVALQMASGIRTALRIDGNAADIGLATTGIAGPDSPDRQPVGTVHVAVCTPTAARTQAHHFSGDRAAVRAQAVAAVLKLAAQMLRE